MAINVTTTSEKVTATVADEKVQATVSGGGAVSATVTAGFGAVGPSGVVTVTAPITNTGTSTTANVGISLGDGLSVSDGSLRVTPGTYATLVNGLVPAGQLPSYVDDVLEFANLASLPNTGETGKIYVTLNTGKIYRWSGSAYFEISTPPANTDAVPEGSSNLYFTNARARNAFGTGTDGQVITWSGGQWTAGAVPSHTHDASVLTAGTVASARLPIASANALGAVRIGSGISIDGSGVISASSGYTLLTATNTVLGGVKIGSGVTITDGVISVATNYLPLSGGEMDTNATVILNDGFSAVEIAGNSVNVALVGGDQHAVLEYTGLTVHDGADATILGDGVLSLPNGTSLAIGSFDTGIGGYHGISLNCAVGVELNWQAGHLKATSDSGVTASAILCDSPIEFPGQGTDNVAIDATGLTFADGSTQTTAAVALPQALGTGDSVTFSFVNATGGSGNVTSTFNGFGLAAGPSPGGGITYYHDGITFGDASFQDTAWTGTVAAGDVTGLATVATSGAYSDLTGLPTLGTAAAANTGDFAAASHNQAWSTITSTPTTLSGYGITDAVSSSDARLTDSRTPLSHTHGNITNAGAIGSTSGQIVVTTTGGVLTTAASISASQVSGLAASATTDTTNATNISGGTLPEGRLPNAVIIHPFLLAGM